MARLLGNLKVPTTVLTTATATTMFWGLLGMNYQPEQKLTTKAVVKDVYDGDTVVVSIQKDIRVRMLDCWAPEIKTRDLDEKERGQKSRDFLKSLLKNDDEVIIEIPMTDRIQDSFTFGRVLAFLWKDVDGDGEMENISEIMIENDHATITKER